MRTNTGELLQSAQSLLQANDLKGACEAYTELSTLLPEDAHVWFTLGALQGKLGDMRMAANCFDRVTRLAPGQPEAYSNLGMALHSQGDFDGAGKAYLRALELQPGRPDILSNLAWLRGQQQRYDEAADLYRQVLATNPRHAAAHQGLGSALQALEQLSEAEASYRQALELDPHNAAALDGLGVVLHKQGELEQAVTTLEHAVALAPESAQAHYHLGMTLFDKGAFEQASAHIRNAIRLRPDYPEAYVTLGRILQALGALEESIRHYRYAIDLKPDCAETYVNLGMALQGQGKYDEALNVFRTAREIAPDAIDAIAGEAGVHERRGDIELARQLLDPPIERGVRDIGLATVYAAISTKLGTTEKAITLLEQLLPGKEQSPARRGEIHLALGSVYQHTKDYDRAFQNFQTANGLYPYHFEREAFRQQVDRIIRAFDKKAMTTLPRAANTSDRPVFIVAMPRSGTSLTEQILAAHPLVHGAGELPFIDNITSGMAARMGVSTPYPDCVATITHEVMEQFSQEYLDGISALAPSDAVRVTDKMPHNFIDLGLIELLFPQARIIHISRDPRDTCVSIYTHHFAASHAYATDLGDLGFYYREYQRLMAHWRKVLTMPLLDLRYEDIVEDPEGEIRKIIDFCGLEWSDNCLNFHENRRDVATPSYDQVRQPIYKGSVGRWQRYEKFLSPLIDELNRAP